MIYIDVKHVVNQMTGVVLWKERDGKIVTKGGSWLELIRYRSRNKIPTDSLSKSINVVVFLFLCPDEALPGFSNGVHPFLGGRKIIVENY